MKILSVILLFSLLFVSLPIASNAELSTSVSAQHATLYVPATDTFLFEKNGDTRAPMASTTKIMTAIVAIDAGNIDRTVTIPEEACGIEGSSIYMTPGETLTLRELLYALLLQSANDAATAIAYAVAGSIPAFSDLMNQRATVLGLCNTHFDNPHGLDSDTHYTTAKDLAKIAAYAMDNDTFREIVSTVKYTIPHGNDGDVRVLVNHNKLLRMYDDAVGVKTGFTKKSGRCLVGAAEKDGLTLISVTLDAPNDWSDHIHLFEYGYDVMENRCLCTAGEFIFELPVIESDNTYARCVNRDAVYAVMKKTDSLPTIQIDLPHFMNRTLRTGRVVGMVRFLSDGIVIAECPLILSEFT